ncbi:FAS-associated death domain protein-like [Emydura macquarii macquarii]|uniref:FAS-associated death domain protein-like n=1 Tax=Emydura macquarii macquarii TaxID=1129001 RepID=UPI00352B9B9C
MATGEQLLHTLEELSEEEFRKLKFLLPNAGTAPHIPRGRLDGASRIQVTQLLEQRYPEEALDVMRQVLYKIPRQDLVQRDRLQTAGEAGNGGEGAVNAGTGAREPQAQERQTPPVSQKQLMMLAGKMGRAWRQIGIEFLGLENHCLEQIEENNPRDTKLQVFNMLLEWKNRARERATASRLYAILSQDGVPLPPEALDCLRDTGSA